MSRLFTSLLAAISALDSVTYLAVAITTLGCAAVAAEGGMLVVLTNGPEDTE